MAPSPSYSGVHDGEAHPSSDRMRGSLRSGDISLHCHCLVATFSVAMAPSPSYSAATTARRRRYIATALLLRFPWRWRPRHRIPAFTTARSTPIATACAAHFVRGIFRHCPVRRVFRSDGALAIVFRSHDGEEHPYSDRMRGSLRSGDISPLPCPTRFPWRCFFLKKKMLLVSLAAL